METAASAMGFLVNCDAIILDLRDNHGGASGGTLLCSYFFKEETHLTDFYNRMENFTRQGWTYPVAGAEKFADKDLYILTSHETFSAAEAVAHDMKMLKRATIVGETTHGGANPTTIFRINDHFSAGIPFARSIHPTTSTDEEGAGVKPDVAVSANQALATAQLLALNKALAKTTNNPTITDELKRSIAKTETELAALKSIKSTSESKTH
jgi:C-terminal processing protease CtpA/Prc